VCPVQQVKELQREFPKAQVLEVAGAAHPVPFNAMVNQFVLASLHLPAPKQLKPIPEQIRQVPVQSTLQLTIPPETARIASKSEVLPEPLSETEPLPGQLISLASDQTKPKRAGLLALIRQLLGAPRQ
jgi:hypothetical protein